MLYASYSWLAGLPDSSHQLLEGLLSFLPEMHVWHGLFFLLLRIPGKGEQDSSSSRAAVLTFHDFSLFHEVLL